MKFVIFASETDKSRLLDCYPFLKDKVEKIELNDYYWNYDYEGKFYYYTIEINSIKELLELEKLCKCRLILTEYDIDSELWADEKTNYGKMPAIEIYDGYRE